jgi:hypothetical protein
VTRVRPRLASRQRVGRHARTLAGLALAGLGCGLLAACASAPPPPVPLPRDDARPAALLERFARDAERRLSLRGVARLSLDGPAGAGRAKQVLVAERPARLRVEVLGFLDQTVAVLATDGERYRLFRSEDHSVASGLVHPALLWEVAGLAVTPEQAVRLLLGAPETPARATVAAGELLPAGGVRLELRAPDGAERQRLEFDRSGRLCAWAALDPEGRARAEARWTDYRPLGDLAFAYELELLDHASGTRARLRFVQVELNPELPREIFDLSAGGSG